MSPNVSKNSKNIPIEHDTDDTKKNPTQLPRNAQENRPIKSEAQYSQKTSDRLNATETKDIATEAIIETDNVHITADIYSATDITDSPQKPGMLVSECYGGECVILRSSRSKTVNTEGSFGFVDRCLRIFSGFKKKREKRSKNVETTADPARQNFEFADVEAPRRAALQSGLVKVVESKRWPLLCDPTCPNLIVTRASQTDGDVSELAMTLEEQGDSGQIISSRVASMTVKQTDGETVCTNTVAISMTHAAEGRPRSSPQVNLSTIPEEELAGQDAASAATNRETEKEYSLSVASSGTQDVGSMGEEAAVSKMLKTEDTLADKGEFDSSVQVPVSETGDAEEISIQEIDSSIMEEADGTEEGSIHEEYTVYETQDVATDALDLNLSQKTSSRRERRVSANKFEMGTIISSQSIYLSDAPQRRKHCGEISTRISESICCTTGIRNCVPCWPNVLCPTNNRVVQCEISGNIAKTCHSMSNQQVCGESSEHTSLCSRCINHATRSCDEESTRRMDSNELWSTSYRSSKSNSAYGSIQEPFTCHQLARTNNAHGYSMAGEPFENCARYRSIRNNAWNQYYLNSNKAYNGNARWNSCWCNNGYSFPNANAFYCEPRNQMVYHAPANYSYSYNAWY